MSAKRSKVETLGLDASVQPVGLEGTLRKTSLEELLKDRKRREVVTLNHSATVLEALDELAENSINSAPVVLSSSTEDDDGNTYMGIIDVNTLLKAVMEDVLDGAEGVSVSEKWEKLKQGGQDFERRQVMTLLGHDVTLAFRGGNRMTILDVIRDGFLGEGLKEEAHELHHRIAIFNPHGHITDIVSQADVIRFVDKHAHHLGPLGDKTAEELGLAKKNVVTVKTIHTAADAFHVMHEKKVSGVAVVDANGVLCHNLSTSDLRGIRPGHLPLLLLTVPSFLRAEHIAPKRVDKDGTPEVISCKPSATLKSIIHTLATNRLHRVYICDEHKKPIGVVTLTDLLKIIDEHCAK